MDTNSHNEIWINILKIIGYIYIFFRSIALRRILGPYHLMSESIVSCHHKAIML